MICQLQIIIFFCPFGILQYKFLSYREVLHVLSELSELSKLSELIELPEVFSSMKKCLLHGALRPGGPLLELLELRFVSSSSETSRSFGTTQSSQSSIGSHPAFPDEGGSLFQSALACDLDCVFLPFYGLTQRGMKREKRAWMQILINSKHVIT